MSTHVSTHVSTHMPTHTSTHMFVHKARFWRALVEALGPELLDFVALSTELNLRTYARWSPLYPILGLSVCPSVHPSVRLSVTQSVLQSVSLSVRPSVRASVSPSVSRSVHQSVRSSIDCQQICVGAGVPLSIGASKWQCCTGLSGHRFIAGLDSFYQTYVGNVMDNESFEQACV